MSGDPASHQGLTQMNNKISVLMNEINKQTNKNLNNEIIITFCLMPLSIFWGKQLEKKQRKNIKTPKKVF